MGHHPKLAEEFGSLRQELDSPFAIPSEKSSDMSVKQHLEAQQSAIRRRKKVVKDLDDILLKIRQKPGFENFLRPASEAFFLSAAHEGPIVVLNVTELRSDAIIITRTEVKSIPLQNLSHDSLVKYCGTSTSDNKAMREVLEWLWKGAVQPVLLKLGFYPQEVNPLPRIWWIGVGLMVKAPIHAAAKFKKGRVHMTTHQYCVPSYTSTMRYVGRLAPYHHPMITTVPIPPSGSSL
ncbi:hypothetical protein L211DRAFT_850621 [Terfezia boudieri ATCC MYA-4762]|uniref:Uncharacterized protein n=1 Tax=Terfezia boudieri ATCC MYA-4762 TaxID=1051890 RepID=A0A3N4LI91_9PEZI|nr:hypothetical protein L211DRAFT_850621 [Terfezia boudieri ATCC MYA-4762]